MEKNWSDLEEERKKKKRREEEDRRARAELAAAQRNMFVRGTLDLAHGIVKTAARVVSAQLSAAWKIFEGNEFLKAFLHESGLKKIPDYQKEISENTAKIVKTLRERER